VPKIAWPQQPMRIRDACCRHGIVLAEDVARLLALGNPPPMNPQVARAFLRCFYAARDLDRAERDLRDGGTQTQSFAAKTMGRRLGELRRHLAALSSELSRAS
jgi:hypothetical protein